MSTAVRRDAIECVRAGGLAEEEGERGSDRGAKERKPKGEEMEAEERPDVGVAVTGVSFDRKAVRRAEF